MADRNNSSGKTVRLGMLLTVLIAVALIAAFLFVRLKRQTSSAEAAGVGPLGLNPAAPPTRPPKLP